VKKLDRTAEKAAHRLYLEAKHGLSNHPKKDMLYNLVCEISHNPGWEPTLRRIEERYDEVAALLKATP
jgi:hypothetical protein